MGVSSPLQEIRHTLFRMFGGASSKVPESTSISIGLTVRDGLHDGRDVQLTYGTEPGLIDCKSVALNGGGLCDEDSVLAVAPTIRGGGDDCPSVIRLPPTSPAHLETPPINSVALVLNSGRKAKVHCPPIITPSRTKSHSLPAKRIAKPTVTMAGLLCPRLAGRKSAKLPIPRIGKPRVHVLNPSRIKEIPIYRKRLPMPAAGSLSENICYPDERSALSRSSGLPSADIKLVGVYCLVPLGAASRMDFEEETGALLLMIRDDAQSVMSRMSKPVVTIVMGREKATGKMVRAVMA